MFKRFKRLNVPEPKLSIGEYMWRASIYANVQLHDDAPLFRLKFFTKRQATDWKQATTKSTNSPRVVIDKVKITDEDGYIS